jgi:diphthamide synthase (EF-2-diphthine--ammonia ligase)
LWTTGIIDILLNSMIENIKTICDENSVKLHQISWKENITKLIEEYNLFDNGYGHWDKTTVDMMNKMFYNELKNELE